MNDDPVQSPNPVQNPVPDDSLNQPFSVPVSSPAKEAQPFYDSSKNEKYIENSAKEPELSAEVENAGIQKVSEDLKLNAQQKDAGISLAKESTPVATEPSRNVVLPLTSAQAKIDAKGNPGNSIAWLANLVVVYLKKLGGQNA